MQGGLQAFVLVRFDFLFLPTCLFNFGSSNWPCDFSSLMDLRRIVDFHFVQIFFSSSVGGSDSFQVFTCWMGNHKFTPFIFACIPLNCTIILVDILQLVDT